DPTLSPTVANTPSATATTADTPTATASPTATDTPTAAPTATPIAPGPGSLPLTFEAFGIWRRGDQPNGTFTQTTEKAHSGASSAMFSYDFSTADNDFVVFLQSNAVSGSPNTLQLWVYGDASGHYLNVWIEDSNGQTWQVPLGRVLHTDWQQMTGHIAVGQEWPWTHIGGPDNGQVDYPILFRAFVLDDRTNDYVGQGTIYLDDLTASEN
ncbi:MAG: flagellar filament outer layer protein FlaA, partial [Chloroflexota bacterium]